MQKYVAELVRLTSSVTEKAEYYIAHLCNHFEIAKKDALALASSLNLESDLATV